MPIVLDIRMAIFAAPAYFKALPPAQAPQDLTDHDCINLGLPTSGGFYIWDFREGGRELKVRLQDRRALNAVALKRNGVVLDLQEVLWCLLSRP